MKNDLIPLVTVVIATFNSSRSLKLTLESVLAQDFADYEVWVVGDACTDNSQDIVHSFGDKRLQWKNLSHNSGSQGAPNNEGIRRARGEYIAYLGHDDLWFPWHLSNLISFIQKTNADLVHSLSAMFSPRGLEYTVGPPSIGRTYENHFVFPSSWLHHRRVIEDCGGWGDHLKLPRGVDMDFQRRVHLAGKNILFYPRLSLLKFPSALWRTYALDSRPPQSDYLDLMRSDPADLQHNILMEAATLLARQSNQRIPVRQALRELLRSLCYKIMESYGNDHWPLAQLGFWRIQRKRRRLRNSRGLPPYQPHLHD
jgi:glycosyltransferase involved in cell wall biosynthesis